MAFGDDKRSIENELPEESHITINGINAVGQMNTAKINIDPETVQKSIKKHHSN